MYEKTPHQSGPEGHRVTLMDRVCSLEINVAGHEKGSSLQIEQLQHDVRFLASVLGVRLPSQEEGLATERRYTGSDAATPVSYANLRGKRAGED